MHRVFTLVIQHLYGQSIPRKSFYCALGVVWHSLKAVVGMYCIYAILYLFNIVRIQYCMHAILYICSIVYIYNRQELQ